MTAESSGVLERGRDRRRRPRSVILLRRVEVDSPVHRLWAGTKLLCVAALSFTLTYLATWPAIGAVAALLVGAAALARIPRSAVPRPPLWFWAAIVVGGLLTLAAGGKPELAVGAVHVGLGDLASYVLFLAVAFELFAAAALIGWTTGLGDVGPAVAAILRPLRWLRLPVDEWAVAIALCIRSLPLLVGEVRVVVAARRLRPRRVGRSRLDGYLEDGVELLVCALSVSLRRAAEMAEAMTARGGPRGATARVAPPGWADLAAGGIVAALCAAAWLAPR